jgi:hypothetical protein
MTLLPGARLTVAPHFHLPIDWRERVQIGTLAPRPSWRPAGADELAALLADPTAAPSREELCGYVCLFGVPAHLRGAFWDLLEQAHERGRVPPEGFDAFVAELARFLDFKGLAVPAGAAFELVVTGPGQLSLDAGPLWGAINLGEQAASVVLGNHPDDPAVRLRLEPGEGVRLPHGVLVGRDTRDSDQPEVLLVIRS